MSSGQNVKDLFDGYAVEFDSIYGGSRSFYDRLFDRWFRKSMLLRFRKSVEECEPVEGRRILDVGCGPGHYAVLLAQKGAGQVTGVDFSTSMIGIAQKHAQENGVDGQCEFLVKDVLDYQPAEPFDVAVVMGVMDYIPQPVPFIRHLLSITKGKILFSFPVDDGLLAWQRRLRYRWFSNCELNMYTESSLRDVLEQAAPGKYTIERIARDFFVTVHVNG